MDIQSIPCKTCNGKRIIHGIGHMHKRCPDCQEEVSKLREKQAKDIGHLTPDRSIRSKSMKGKGSPSSKQKGSKRGRKKRDNTTEVMNNGTS